MKVNSCLEITSINQGLTTFDVGDRFFAFIAGVKAALVRKDNKPKWNPCRLEDVTEESIEHFFQPFANGDELPM